MGKRQKPRFRAFVGGASFAATAVLGSSIALSQPTAAEQKQINEACEASYEQAQIEQNAGHLMAAKEEFGKCAAERCPAVVSGECAKALADLESQIPTVVFDAIDEKGAQIIATKISVDGKPAAESIDGHDFPIDPGPHKVRFEAAGQEPVEVDIVVLAGQQHRAVQGRYGGDTAKHDGGGERPFGVVPWIVAGSGVVIAGVGIGLLVNGLGDISDAEDKCPGRVCADQASVDLGQGGIAKSTAGKVLIPIGAVALAGGLVWQFVFNGKRTTAVKVQANTSFVGLSVSGRY